MASGSGWNLWVWLLGVVVRRYIRPLNLEKQHIVRYLFLGRLVVSRVLTAVILKIPLLPFLPSQENTEENNDCKVKRPGPEKTESNCTFVRCTTTRLLYMVHSYVRCVQGVIKNLIFDRVLFPSHDETRTHDIDAHKWHKKRFFYIVRKRAIPQFLRETVRKTSKS